MKYLIIPYINSLPQAPLLWFDALQPLIDVIGSSSGMSVYVHLCGWNGGEQMSTPHLPHQPVDLPAIRGRGVLNVSGESPLRMRRRIIITPIHL